jgi:hypothetical protein
MGKNSVRIKDITIKSGDLVEIKFKKLEEILDFYKQHNYRRADVFSSIGLGDHLVTLVNGGIFHVEETNEHNLRMPEIGRNQKPRLERPHEITINDHNNSDFEEFTFNEHIIESITVREDVGDRYFSDKFQLSLVKIDGLLVINGVPVGSEDTDLIEILEKTIADMSIMQMLGSDEKEANY